MSLILPNRCLKPRSSGITSIHDVGISLDQQRGILSDYSAFLDFAKIGIGCAYILPNLLQKISLYHDHEVKVCFGGTLFEKFYHQNRFEEYLAFCVENSVDAIEISCGTIDIPIDQRCKILSQIPESFLVLAEVGTKDADCIMSPSDWLNEIHSLLDAGAHYIITEGRDSGTAGLFRPSGEIRDGLLADIIKNFNLEKLIFEAPTARSQMHFINLIGANVNLGNISPFDIPLLEAQRCSLRSETFFANC